VATYPGFLGDGHTAIVVGSDGSVHTLDTEARAWVSFACALAGRDLTAAEWAEALGDREYRPTCSGQLIAPR
jgi:predicted ATP-grasp superfamily ATP-dependent carboligase